MSHWGKLRSHRGAATGASGLAVALVAGLALVNGIGHSHDQVILTSGGAWLASPQRGYVTLIDGPSEQVVATVLAPSAGAGISVTQDGTSAFVADDATGSVSRIDGATYQLSTPKVIGQPGSSLSVLSAGETAFVINSTARVATVADATDLTVIRSISLAARPGPQQTMVDDGGRLWTVDSGGGGLSWFDGNGQSGRADADGAARLTEVQGRPVVVDFDQRTTEVNWLHDDASRDPWPCELAARPADAVEVLGSAVAERVFAAVSETGTLMVSDSAGSCGEFVQVGDPGVVLGALAQSGQFVFIPNHSTGSTIVVDTNSQKVVADLPLTDPGNDLELLTKDGLVFYNDLDSEKAGVLRLDAAGSWIAGKSLQKYDPATGAAEELVNASDALTTQQQSPELAAPAADPATATASQPPTDVGAVDPTTADVPPPATPPGRVPPSAAITPTTQPATVAESDSGLEAEQTTTTGTTASVSESGKPSVYALRLTIEGQGSVSGPPEVNCQQTCESSVNAGTVLLTAVPAPGATFTGWSGPCNDSNPTCQFEVSASTEVKATFTEPPKSADLHIEIVGSGVVDVVQGELSSPCAPPGCNLTLQFGELSLTARPDVGSRFVGWSNAPCTTAASCGPTLGKDGLAQTATFEVIPPPSLSADTDLVDLHLQPSVTVGLSLTDPIGNETWTVNDRTGVLTLSTAGGGFDNGGASFDVTITAGEGLPEGRIADALEIRLLSNGTTLQTIKLDAKVNDAPDLSSPQCKRISTGIWEVSVVVTDEDLANVRVWVDVSGNRTINLARSGTSSTWKAAFTLTDDWRTWTFGAMDVWVAWDSSPPPAQTMADCT